MILVVAQPFDRSASWMVEQLRAQGSRVQTVTPSEMLEGTWSLGFGPDSPRLSVSIDGRDLFADPIHGVLNRIPTVPEAALLASDAGDRDYVAQELHALLLAFLDAIPAPVLNPPTPTFLGGYAAAPLCWAMNAARSGLRLAPSAAVDITGRILVLGNRAWTRPQGLDDSIVDSTIRLSQRIGCPMVEVFLDEASRFVGGTPWIDVGEGDEPFVDALANAFVRGNSL